MYIYWVGTGIISIQVNWAMQPIARDINGLVWGPGAGKKYSDIMKSEL